MDVASKVLIKTSDLMVSRNPDVILGLVILAVFVLFINNNMPQSREEGAMPKIGETFCDLK